MSIFDEIEVSMRYYLVYNFIKHLYDKIPNLSRKIANIYKYLLISTINSKDRFFEILNTLLQYALKNFLNLFRIILMVIFSFYRRKLLLMTL